jgi:hypothetical protein
MFFDGFVSQRTLTTTTAAESDILMICCDKATRMFLFKGLATHR